VTNDSATSSYASVQLWRRGADGWVSEGGPWPARIGRNGFSSSKHEGDGKTPVGSFPFGVGFGVQADPGYRFGWRRVDGSDVWVDDPASALYNSHQRLPADGRWTSAEAMDQPGPYAYAALIDYNVDPVTPNAGSAIFFHVGTGGATAGCVSLPVSELLTALRWLDPSAHPRMVMGPVSAIT
jgi:L,D-peptidoglycan transpeptidase YkuD (ErfK/YbiS/YcfS/YnhG family)